MAILSEANFVGKFFFDVILDYNINVIPYNEKEGEIPNAN